MTKFVPNQDSNLQNWDKSEAQLMREHQAAMDQLYLLYHVHPTNIPHGTLTPRDIAEQAEMDGYIGMQAKGGKSKQVVFYSRRHPNGRVGR